METDFGSLPEGRATKLYTLSNKNGLTARVSDFGATLVALMAPDRDGHFADITLGFDSVNGYQGETNPYFGATVGRHANRMTQGRFRLNGCEYQLATNNSPNGIPCHLHGGIIGFNKRLWTVEARTPASITFRYISENGEEGYPGTLTTRLTYTLNDKNELIWEAAATTDAPTIVNIVHHTYWNLSNYAGSSINSHSLQLPADHFLPIGPDLTPTGAIAPVAGTPLDFTRPTLIGERVDADFDALRQSKGYDHCWVLNQHNSSGLARVATVYEPQSGRLMKVFSNQPGVQFYGGNFLDGSIIGKDGVRYRHRSGFCLETENFPDAPNHPNFPSASLNPGERYQHTTVFQFSAQ